MAMLDVLWHLLALRLVCGNISCRGVGAWVSKATARCVGFWFWSDVEQRVGKTVEAEVLTRSLVRMGLLMKAKCAR